jgi:hypothetical protein
MLPDGGRIMQNVNTQAAQSLGRADAAAHQNAGAMDGAGAKHHFARPDIFKIANAETHAHTGSAAPLLLAYLSAQSVGANLNGGFMLRANDFLII